ncbi:MAG: helix-turn-helix domain-containing protein [Muribaculaceae bacterium]|nr:helix-turn-helix domain-containing protein [Muribaculaceae bacterium]
MEDIKKKFGKNLKYYRELNGLTQEELAERINLNCRSLSFIECGTNFVTAKTLALLCNSLNITPKQLFDFEFYPHGKVDLDKDIQRLINSNKNKLNDIYKILNGFLS